MEIFLLALKGEALSVKNLSERYNISSRSVTRSIGEIKNFLAEHRELVGNAELEYSSVTHAYQLRMDSFLTNRELLGVAKVLLGSRAFDSENLVGILAKLKDHTNPSDREKLDNLMRKEIYHYSPVHTDTDDLLDVLWKISDYIEQKRYISISYYKMDRTRSSYKLKPMSIMFSEYYFYLIAYKDDGDDTPYYFRLDRIVEMTAHREFFNVERDQLVDEGLIRFHSQYMFAGKSRRITFSFSGPSLQAILDRIPTAKIMERRDGKYILEAEIFGMGIKMFLLSQGSWVEVLSPQEFREEMRIEVEKMRGMYN